MENTIRYIINYEEKFPLSKRIEYLHTESDNLEYKEISFGGISVLGSVTFRYLKSQTNERKIDTTETYYMPLAELRDFIFCCSAIAKENIGDTQASIEVYSLLVHPFKYKDFNQLKPVGNLVFSKENNEFFFSLKFKTNRILRIKFVPFNPAPKINNITLKEFEDFYVAKAVEAYLQELLNSVFKFTTKLYETKAITQVDGYSVTYD